ncbi:MAG: DUF5717 family protein [Eubacteriales bacterium]|nr:DUF5717 family protein [Eubacteriales bacterium]
MKKRISELLNEKFKYEQDRIIFSEEKLERRVRKGKCVRGKFTLRSEKGQILRGFLSASGARMRLQPDMFTGKQETVTWEFDMTGLADGEVAEGVITACTTAGEYTLPFCFCAEKEDKKDRCVPDISPEDFVEMAKEDFGRAYVLFASEEFANLTDGWGENARALYEGIRGQSVNYHSLEQFLVGMGLKPPVSLHLEAEQVLIRDPQEDTREELLLVKDVWGFAPVQISCDDEFVMIERQKVTTEEFVGSIYSIGYVIQKSKLHAGRNFARIKILCECRELFCDIEVRRSEGAASSGMMQRQRQEILQMMTSYISWRCNRVGDKEWAAITGRCLDNYRRAGGNHIFYDLYQVYMLFLTNGQVEAEMLLQEVTARKEELVVPQWKGFYLYLTTMGNSDPEYIEYVKSEINDLFLANRENWILQWVMFRINGNMLRSDSEKLDAIRRQYVCGCTSPVMYLEAWEILKKEPLTMRVLGAFETHLLKFLCRENLLDREICGQAAQLAARVPSFQPVLYDVLCQCFEKYPTKNMLTAICSLLMKGHKNSPGYAKWFELGVRQDVRLAGLYEYYALTAVDLNEKDLPQSVRMYFSYNNTLGYEKKAAIYANIIRNRLKNPETYETYRPAMELFMEEQLQAGRINSDLALIDDVLLTPFVLNREMTEGLSKALFTFEVTCSVPGIRHIVAVHRQLRQEQKVMLTDGKAMVQMYCDDCSLMLEDRDGVRYADPSMYEIKRLLSRQEFEDYCRKAEEIPRGMILHDCCGPSGKEISSENCGWFVKLMAMRQIRSDYRRDIQKKLLDYYAQNPAQEYLEEYLDHADYEELCRDNKEEIMELLVSNGKCREAYEIVKEQGNGHVKKETLVRLCSWKINDIQKEEDKFLLSMCRECFEKGLYDEAGLDYLLKFYEGPIGTMKHIWLAGRGFFMERYEFEEKILALVLFMQSGEQDTEKIFESYRKKQGKAWLCRAYVIWMSYCYFVREQAVDQVIFNYIEQSLCGEINMPQICQLALLRRYAYTKHLSAGQQKWMLHYMDKYTQKGMRFKFFEKFPAKMLRRFHLHDKYFIEYRTKPEDHVILHYSLNGGKLCSVPMDHIYEGIFVREFTLFYRDKIEWYLTVEGKNTVKETEKCIFTCERRSPRGVTGQYELLNRLTEAGWKQDEKQIQQVKEQYIGQQYFVDEFFGIN